MADVKVTMAALRASDPHTTQAIYDEGFAAGVAAERERCAAMADAKAGGEPRMDGSTVYRNPAMVKLAAAIRAGEVRG